MENPTNILKQTKTFKLFEKLETSLLFGLLFLVFTASSNIFFKGWGSYIYTKGIILFNLIPTFILILFFIVIFSILLYDLYNFIKHLIYGEKKK